MASREAVAPIREMDGTEPAVEIRQLGRRALLGKIFTLGAGATATAMAETPASTPSPKKASVFSRLLKRMEDVRSLRLTLGMKKQAEEILEVDYQNTWKGGFQGRTPEAISVAKAEKGGEIRFRFSNYMRAGAIWMVYESLTPAFDKHGNRRRLLASLIPSQAAGFSVLLLGLLMTTGCAAPASGENIWLWAWAGTLMGVLIVFVWRWIALRPLNSQLSTYNKLSREERRKSPVKETAEQIEEARRTFLKRGAKFAGFGFVFGGVANKILRIMHPSLYNGPFGIQVTDRVFIVPDVIIDTLSLLDGGIDSGDWGIVVGENGKPYNPKIYRLFLEILKGLDPELHARIIALPEQGLPLFNSIYRPPNNILITVRGTKMHDDLQLQLRSEFAMQHFSHLREEEKADLLLLYEEMAQDEYFQKGIELMFGDDPDYMELKRQGIFWEKFWATYLWPELEGPDEKHEIRRIISGFLQEFAADPKTAKQAAKVEGLLRVIQSETEHHADELLQQIEAVDTSPLRSAPKVNSNSPVAGLRHKAGQLLSIIFVFVVLAFNVLKAQGLPPTPVKTADEQTSILQQPLQPFAKDAATGWPIIPDLKTMMWLNQRESLPFRPGEIDANAVRHTLAGSASPAKDSLVKLGIDANDSDEEILKKFNTAMNQKDLYVTLNGDQLTLRPNIVLLYNNYKKALGKRAVRQASTWRINRAILQGRLAAETAPSQPNSPQDPNGYDIYLLQGKERVAYLQMPATPSMDVLINHLGRVLCFVDLANDENKAPGIDDGKITELDDRDKNGVLDIEDMRQTVALLFGANYNRYEMAVTYSTEDFVKTYDANLDAAEHYQINGKPLKVRFSAGEMKLLGDLEKAHWITRDRKGHYKVKKQASVMALAANLLDDSTPKHEFWHANKKNKDLMDEVATVWKNLVHDRSEIERRLRTVSNPNDLLLTEFAAYGSTGFSGSAFDWSDQPFDASEVDMTVLKEILKNGSDSDKTFLKSLGISENDTPEQLLKKLNAPIENSTQLLDFNSSSIPKAVQAARDLVKEAESNKLKGRQIDIGRFNRFVLQMRFPGVTAKSGKGLEIDNKDEIQNALIAIAKKYMIFVYPKTAPAPPLSSRQRRIRTKLARRMRAAA
jgi:hypothetical protein